MKKLFAFILLSLLTTAAFAQNTVTGSVKDAVTGEPLIGVGVIVSTGGGTVTDLDGSFSVNAGKDATLTKTEVIPYNSPRIQYQIPLDETSVSGIPTNER